MSRFLGSFFTQNTLQWIVVVVVFVLLFFSDWYKTNNGLLNVVLWLFISAVVGFLCVYVLHSEFMREIVIRFKQGTREHGMRYILYCARQGINAVWRFLKS